MKKLIALILALFMMSITTIVYAESTEENNDIQVMNEASYAFAETYADFDGYMVYCINETGFIATFLYGPEDEFCDDVAAFYNFETGEDFLIYDGCMVLPNIFYQLCDSFGISVADVAPYDELDIVELMFEIKNMHMEGKRTSKNIV